MTTFKTTSGDYTISMGPYDTGNGVWEGTLTINGNVDVIGNISYVTDLKVNDAFIIVAGNNTGTVTSMGLVAQKTSNTFAGLRYNTITSQWEISSTVYANGAPVGSSYSPIATGTPAAAGANTQVQFNNDNVFGANVNLTYNYATSKLTLNGHEVLGNIGTAPSAVANSVAIYNNAEGAGGTGLFVTSTTVTDELISLTKAKLFAIIF
jgi:hypothetical protein